MEDKRFQGRSSESPEDAKQDPLEPFEKCAKRIDRILSDIEYLMELEEYFLRLQFQPFRFDFREPKRRR
jgi:hypothetical protein